MERSEWRVLASTYITDSHYLRVRRDTIELPNGTIVDEYFVRESRGYVIVFAINSRNEVLLVRQYRHGIGRPLLELPAGMIDLEETPSATAARELLEETGHASRSLEHLGSFPSDPSSSNSVMHLFLARDVAPAQPPDLDPTEAIEIQEVPIAEVWQLVRRGEIESAAHVAAVAVSLDRLGANPLPTFG